MSKVAIRYSENFKVSQAKTNLFSSFKRNYNGYCREIKNKDGATIIAKCYAPGDKAGYTRNESVSIIAALVEDASVNLSNYIDNKLSNSQSLPIEKLGTSIDKLLN
jgi:hypothetical protein